MRHLVFTIIVCLLGVMLAFAPAQAASKSKKSSTQATLDAPKKSRGYASIVIDAQTGVVLHAVNMQQTYYPASLTKLMTLYLTFDQLAKGNLKLNQQLKVSKNAARQPSSKLWLKAGDRITVEDAILGLATRSANDASVVLAETIGGSEKQFAQMMTQAAHKIGMNQTKFQNASGLPNRQQMSSAKDMALLARALMLQYPQYYGYFARAQFKFHGKTITTHNHFLKMYKGADGLKTGYINASGYNLVASAVRDNRRLIAVVFGAPSAKWRDTHMAKLMDYGFVKAPSLVAQYQRQNPRLAATARRSEARIASNMTSQRLELRTANASSVSFEHANPVLSGGRASPTVPYAPAKPLNSRNAAAGGHDDSIKYYERSSLDQLIDQATTLAAGDSRP